MAKKFLKQKVKRKQTIALICAVLVLLLAGAVYFFRFTYEGERKFNSAIYAIVGGNDFHLVAKDKELYWVDVHHSNDLNDPMFGNIESALSEFDPDIVLVEGGANTFEGDRNTAIYEGEACFATYIAKKNGIPVEDIEPPFDKQIEYLQTKYYADEILAMYLIRIISSIQMDMSDNSKDDFNRILLQETQFLKNNGLNFQAETPEDILNILNSFLPYVLSANNWRNTDKDFIVPIRKVYQDKGGVLYPVYSDTINFRNLWLVDLIKEKKITYDKIFIVMGSQHLIDTKDQLQQAYLD